MLRLFTFGSVNLEGPPEGDPGAVLAQPKRLALLVYLAAARPFGVHRRDELLALFWPDLDDTRARDALNQALRFLRQALGPEVFIRRGGEDVGINPARLWCDAAAFQEALDAGRPADALGLYRGDFLQGFFIEEGGGFEEWMERERSAQRESAGRGARQLAETHASDGSLTLAIDWGRRALEFAPDDERALRRLLRWHDRAGDRAGAFRVYEAFARRFAKEFGSEPSEETRELIEKLKAGKPLAEERVAAPPPAPSPRPFGKDPESELGDRYRIVRKLGAGGMATVYLAQDVKHDREVALKVLRPEISEGLARERFLREIRIAAQLQHPNIVPLFDSGIADGRLYFVMPHVQGETLRERLRRDGRLDIATTVHLLREIAGALGYAHDRGVVHRDIKPENILLIDQRAVVSDFGIARAAHEARTTPGDFDTTLTQPGTSLGTPRYMAPEQATGHSGVDHRADLYSLGVVAYEMLGGVTPFAGATAQELLEAQLTQEPTPVSQLRPEVPPGLAALVMECLEKRREQRVQSAAELTQRLAPEKLGALPSRQSGELEAMRPAPTAPAPDRGGFTAARLWVAGMAVAAVAVLAAVYFIRPWGQISLDPTLHVVLPFREADSGAARVLGGRASATLAHESLRRWSDLSRVDQLRVADLLDQRSGSPRTLSQAIVVARAAGAGRLLWGQVSYRGDSLVVEGVLYDVEKPDRAVRENRVAMAWPFDDRVEGRFALMVDSLVAGGQPAPLPGTPRPFAAVEAFTSGIDALRDWDLTRARERFRAALEIAPQFPAASLRFAQAGVWLEDPPSSWRAAAEAASVSPALSEGERLHAAALVDIAGMQYPSACARYRRLIERDSLDFAAWFGLGECQESDDAVLADPQSVSRWRFRTSYDAAAKAYGRALEILPSAHRASREVFQNRLKRVLFTGGGQYRRGRLEGSLVPYAAYPELVADTVRFVPYPLARLLSLDSTPTTTSRGRALDRNRSVLEALASAWIRAFPASATAWGAHASTLESTGRLTGPVGESALESIRRARSLTQDTAAQLRPAVVEVRLRVKAGDYRGARLLADSILRLHRSTSAGEALELAPLAALVGRLGALQEYLAAGASARSFVGPRGESVDPPDELVRPALRLLAVAVLGGSADSLRAYEVLLEGPLQRQQGESRALAVGLLAEPAQFGFPIFGPRKLHAATGGEGPYLLEFQALLARGDSAALRSQLREVDRVRRQALVGPGEVSFDGLYQEAWLRLALGDTLSTIRALDAGLGMLPVQRGLLFDYVQGPAALVYAMALRARLAAQQGDNATARRWAAAVTELWAEADSGLAIGLPELKSLASGGMENGRRARQ